jgi:hypothetical protein
MRFIYLLICPLNERIHWVIIFWVWRTNFFCNELEWLDPLYGARRLQCKALTWRLQNTTDETSANEWITQWKQTMRVQHKSNVLTTHCLLLVWGKGWRVEIVYRKFGFVQPLGKPDKHMLKASNCFSILKAPCNLHVFCMGYMH